MGALMTTPWRTSAPYEHQSQGAIERFHKSLSWLTVQSWLTRQCKKLLPWILQHSCFTINRSSEDGVSSTMQPFATLVKWSWLPSSMSPIRSSQYERAEGGRTMEAQSTTQGALKDDSRSTVDQGAV
eukprot:2200204-Amphidinium_carterae.4